MRRRRGLAGLVAAVAALGLVVLGAGPAGAQPSPGERIAAALARSPVYVDPAYADAVPAAQQAELTSRIRATRLPIRVALVPLAKGDAFDGDPSVLAGVVHDRLGLRDLIVIAIDPSYGMLAGYEWPGDRRQAHDAVAAVGFQDDMEDAGLAARADRAVDLIAAGDGTRVLDRLTAGLGGSPAPSASAQAAAAGSGHGGSALPEVLGAVAAVVVCAGAGVLFARRRRLPWRRGRGGAAFAFPQAVFAAEEAADTAELRRRAEIEVLALGELLDDADPLRPGLRRALDAYAAAGKALDAAAGPPDLAGVLVLVAQGRDAYEGRAGALPLCFFDPRHGRAARRVGWRPLGRRETVDVAACTACVKDVLAHRAPRVLTDVTPEGRRVPYFEVPAARSVWAATGYGSLTPPAASGDLDPPEALIPRILRGDF